MVIMDVSDKIKYITSHLNKMHLPVFKVATNASLLTRESGISMGGGS